MPNLEEMSAFFDSRAVSYNEVPYTLSNQKQMLLAAGFSDVQEVWREGHTLILVARK
ncbi:MAG: hypothetical protein FWC73_02540 [Defluviitaleaceae bacterium]|nr:hypothetical protein [Defluviitaleaceae bacterium]